MQEQLRSEQYGVVADDHRPDVYLADNDPGRLPFTFDRVGGFDVTALCG